MSSSLLTLDELKTLRAKISAEYATLGSEDVSMIIDQTIAEAGGAAYIGCCRANRFNVSDHIAHRATALAASLATAKLEATPAEKEIASISSDSRALANLVAAARKSGQ